MPSNKSYLHRDAGRQFKHGLVLHLDPRTSRVDEMFGGFPLLGPIDQYLT